MVNGVNGSHQLHDMTSWYQIQWFDDRVEFWSHYTTVDLADPHFDKKFKLFYESCQRSYPTAKIRVLKHTTEEVEV